MRRYQTITESKIKPNGKTKIVLLFFCVEYNSLQTFHNQDRNSPSEVGQKPKTTPLGRVD